MFPARPKLACINIDMDSLVHYAGIHGLPDSALPEGAKSLVDRLAFDRFHALLADAGVKGTWFVIGDDLGERGSAVLRKAVAEGHEPGNHTQRHTYSLSALPAEAIARDLSEGADTIERACGVRPRGFRAPGYTFTPAMYAALEAQGYAYGSSTFPAAPYYLAKAAVLGSQRLRGRVSASRLDVPQVLTAPRTPYLPDPENPYRRGRGRVPEMPITVEPLTAFPWIGTFLATMPEPAERLLWKSVSRLPFLNLELHGADLIDGSDGTGEALLAVQRDLNVPATRKIRRLSAIAKRMAGEFEVVTLLHASQRLP